MTEINAGINLDPDRFKEKSESAKAFEDLLKVRNEPISFLNNTPFLNTNQDTHPEIVSGVVVAGWGTPSINYAEDTKPIIQSDNSKIYEELANLRKMLNEERKENKELQKEKEQLKKQLVKAKKREKTFSIQVKEQKAILAEKQTEIENLQIVNNTTEEDLQWKEEHR